MQSTTPVASGAAAISSHLAVRPDWEATKKSYELMARYVHPHFQRQSNTLRNASYDSAKGKHETAGAESAKAVLGEIEKHEKAKGQAAGTKAKAW